MNEIARLMQELEQCGDCPAWTRDRDDVGEPLCEECRVDREAARIDAAYERGREPR